MSTTDFSTCDYAGTTFQKQGVATFGYKTSNSSGGFNLRVNGFAWRSASAMTSVVLTPSSGNFANGSVLSAYLIR